MVEGLSNKVEQGGSLSAQSSVRNSGSASASDTTASRSKRSPMQSGSSGEETSSSSDLSNRRLHLSRAHRFNKQRALNNESPLPASSEAEHTTDSEQIPSSDENSPEVWSPKPQVV